MIENYTRRLRSVIKVCLVFFLLSEYVKTSCKIGCLSCETVNSGHECYVCDTKNYYHLVSKPRSLYTFSFASLLKRTERADRELSEEGGECELFPQCEEVYDRNCAKCAPQYVIKEVSNSFGRDTRRECEAVSTIVKNCLEYEKDGLCAVCETGFFLHEEVRTLKRSPEDQEQCLPWPKVILKCAEHFKDANNNIRCKACEPGYMLSEKMDRCEEHRDENCLIASNVGCDECGTGYDLQGESLNYVPAHVKQFDFAKSVLAALKENRRRADLIQCKPKIDFCRKYITISPFDKQRIPKLEMRDRLHIDMGVDENESLNERESLTDDERILWQAAHTQRQLFEVKFGDDEASKWVIGIAKGKKDNNVAKNNIIGSGIKDVVKNKSSGVSLEKEINSESEDRLTSNNTSEEELHDEINIVTCGRCARGYYLHQVAPLQFECFEAQQIPHCEEYRDRTTCLLCDKNFFLVQNRCEPIAQNNFVQNCRYYTDNQECMVCEGDFALLKMKKELGVGGVQQQLNQSNPYITENYHQRHIHTGDKNTSVVEYGDNEYEVVNQLNITQLIAKETLKEYIEGKRTIDDLKSTNQQPIHYDLTNLNFQFNDEPVSTVVYERQGNADEKQIHEQNLEITKQIEDSMKKTENLDEPQMDDHEKILATNENEMGDGTVIETQVVKKDIVNDDLRDFSEGTHINVTGLNRGIIDKDEDEQSVNNGNQKTEEDMVVINVDNEGEHSQPNTRARRLFNLFSLFRNHNKRNIDELDRGKVLLRGTRISKSRRKVIDPKWKMNDLRSKLQRVMGQRRILSRKNRILEELPNQSIKNETTVEELSQTQENIKTDLNQSEKESVNLQVPDVDHQSVENVVETSFVQETSDKNQSQIVTGNELEKDIKINSKSEGQIINQSVSSGSVVYDNQNSASNILKQTQDPSNSTQKNKLIASQSNESGEIHDINSPNFSSQIADSPKLTENQFDQHSHATQKDVHETTNSVRQDYSSTRNEESLDEKDHDSEYSEGWHVEEQVSEHSVELNSSLNNDKSNSLSNQAVSNKSSKSPEKSTQHDDVPDHDNLKQFHDSKNIVMDTPKALNETQMEHDKEFLDRLFDSEGQNYTDPDKINSQRAKMEMIHKIINQSGLGSPNPNSLTDHLHSNPLNEHKTVQQIIKESGILNSGQDLTLTHPTAKNPLKNSEIGNPNAAKVAMPSKKTLCVILASIPNCAIHLHGKCIQCEEKYYLAGQACKSLSEGKRISYCSVYNSDQRCVKCRDGYQLVEGQCLYFKGVLNCRKQVFYPNGKCLICKHGYVYSGEEKKCVSRESLYFKNETEKERIKDKGGLLKQDDQTETEDLDQFDKNCLLERTNSDKTCYMCRTEYYMNKKGECIFSNMNYRSGFFGIF